MATKRKAEDAPAATPSTNPRAFYQEMMGEEGAVTIAEIGNLRAKNGQLEDEVASLRQQGDILRELSIESIKARLPATQAVEVGLPSWIEIESADPFNDIRSALKDLNSMDEELRKKSVDLQASVDAKTTEVDQLKIELASMRSEKQAVDNLAQTPATQIETSIENAALKSKIDSLTAQNHLLRSDHLKREKEVVRLSIKVTDIIQDNNRLRDEKALLKIEASKGKIAHATIQRMRAEANERVEEQRERHERLTRLTNDHLDSKMKMARIEIEGLREQVKQLQDSGDVAATTTQQAREAQDIAQKKVEESTARASKAEEERSQVIRAQNYLSDQIADLQAIKSENGDDIRRLKESLETASKSIKVLEAQQKESQKKIEGYVEKQKQWYADKGTFAELVTKYQEAGQNCQLARETIKKLEAEVLALQSEAEAREAEDENYALELEDSS
jgi:hypothetical protein